MCHYVTATIPNSADSDAIAAVFEAHGLGFSLVENRHVQPQLHKGDRYVLTTRGSCDCGTPIGSRRTVGRDEPHARELAKLRKRGWSEAKIRRWLEQKRETRERSERQADAAARSRTPEAAEWVALLADVLGHAARVGLLLHWYRGGIDSERITLEREVVPRVELTAERLLSMREDVIYEFQR